MFFRRRLQLASCSSQLTKAPRRKKRSHVFNDNDRRLRLEHLEDRRLLAAVSVSTTNDLLNGDTTSIANLIASDGGDGISLREAITAANATAGLDTVEFNIAGGGVQTIAPTSALPDITDPILIDGYTQPGASVNTNDTSSGLNTVLTIELDGSNFGQFSGIDGLRLVAGSDGSTIRGLAIGRFPERGITIDGSDNNIIAGNFIGIAPDGVTPQGNLRGVAVVAGVAGSTANNAIGGLTPESRNLISGNASNGVDIFGSSVLGTTIQGNLIGTDVAGTSAVGNGGNGAISVNFEPGQTLIGHPSDPAGRNVISGNDFGGVFLFDTNDNTIVGNFIGVDVTGLQPLGNNDDGILIVAGSDDNMVGGPGDAGNLIAFNNGNGILVGSNSSSSNNRIEGNTIHNNNKSGVLVTNDTNPGSTGNRITRNSIHNNTQLGIDLSDDIVPDGLTLNDPAGLFIVGDPLDTDDGPNRLQNFPVFIDDVFVSGGTAQISYFVLSTPPESTFPLTIEFFLADDQNQEGQTFIGSNTYNHTAPGGQLQVLNLAPAVPIGGLVPSRKIVATATDLNGNTSEFSFPASIVLGAPPPDNPGGQLGGPGENDTIETSTLLGSEPQATLSAQIQTILPLVEDIDFYKYTANSTGKLIVNALFSHAGGDIDLQIVDMNGNVLGESATTTDNETIIIPVVGQEMYFIQLAAGEDTVVNSYTLEIENFAAPVPTGLHLDPASDTGMSNSDNVTADTTPTFFIQTDVLEFVDANNNGLADANEIDVLSAAEADAGVSDGIAVEVTLVNTTDGTFVRGFADPIITIFPEVYSFTPAAPLTPGVYLVTSRTMIFDGQGDGDGLPTPAVDRSGVSEPLWFTIDIEAAGGVNADLLTSSDTGMRNDDNVTNKMQPAFQGVAPAGHKVRLYANGELVGNTVAGSDTSDVGIGGVNGLGGASDDGLGLWEITSEPLADNGYDITLEIEDLAGNAFTFDPQLNGEGVPIDIWVDTAVPNTPLLDLIETSDTGRNDTDDITFDDTPTFVLIGNDTVGGVDNPFPNDVKYRLYDRPGSGTGEVLIFDSFATFAGFVTFGQITFTSGTLADGVHNLKLEVEDRAGNISPDFLLTIVVDTVDPPVSFGLPDVASQIDGLNAASDTGVVTMPATFADRITSDTTPTMWGRAEADSIVRLFFDRNGDGALDLINDTFLGQTVALPFDGNDAYPDGFWSITSTLDLNQLVGLPKDGLPRLLVTAEDVAGNPLNQAGFITDVDVLDIFLDTQGPQVDNVFITDVPDYDLFDPKPSENGPTPLVHSVTIDFVDQPNRVVPDFVYEALKNDIATSPGNYLLVGDHVGTIAIDAVSVTASSIVNGAPSATSIALTFVAPLPDDRFTLTILDNLVDPAGNQLDGESNANEPLETPTFPSGDGVPGGDFVARFTIDTRPEIGSYISEGINLDINGNFVWDPANGQIGNDATNVDLAFTLPVADPADGSIALGGFSVHDLLFAGKFAPQGGLIVGDDAVFIIDVSGSTSNSFGGDPVGDQNSDALFDRVLDAEIAAFKALNQELIDQGLGNTSQVSIVSFSSSATSLDMDPVAPGVQLTTTPLADVNSNGMRDVDEVLMGLNDGGGTNYEAALTEASSTVAAIGTPNINVIFLSDGAPNVAGAHADEAAILVGQGVNLRAFGVGPAVPLAQLLIIDPNAETFANTNDLLNVFGGGGVVPGGSISGFDQLAAYGNSAELGAFRWIIDTNSNGVVNPADGDIISIQPLQTGFDVEGAIPLAGNFDGNVDNGDEIALYNFGTWILDTDRDFVIETNGDDTIVTGTLLGHPFAGDFDGDGLDDLAVFNNNVFSFDLANDGFGSADASGDLDDTFVWGFPGVLDRPVAADMDQDGIDDIGLWVPRDSAQLPQGVAEWYFLLSNDFIPVGGAGNRITGSVNTLDHPFEPVPFGNDLFAEFGDERSLPIVGNFDPPVAEVSEPGDPTGQEISENADFDADGDVDGSDFLAWQRGFGIAPPADEASNYDGDANADGTVDANDLIAWEAGFGSSTSQSLASVTFVAYEEEQLAASLVSTEPNQAIFESVALTSSDLQRKGQVALVKFTGLDASSHQASARLAAADVVFENGQHFADDDAYFEPLWNRFAQQLSEKESRLSVVGDFSDSQERSSEEEALDMVFSEEDDLVSIAL